MKTWTFVTLRADTRNDMYGPGGKGCVHNGMQVDAVPLDLKFTCDCNRTGYIGQNCEIETLATGSEDFGGVTTTAYVFAMCLGAVVVAALLVAGVTKFRKHKEANAPADFTTQLQSLKDAGLVDPEQPSQDRVPRELKRGWVTTIDRLGHGKFGEVWKGLLADADNAANVPEYLVAIKVVLRPSGGQDDDHAAAATENELLREALLMAQVESHKHLVSLVGVVTRGHPKMLVLSFCEHGELQGMLKKHAADGDAFAVPTKHRFCTEIAAGMSLLAHNNIVHRDLATRNVLLASGMVCKVADLGMSRQVQADDNTGDYMYYRRCVVTCHSCKRGCLFFLFLCVCVCVCVCVWGGSFGLGYARTELVLRC